MAYHKNLKTWFNYTVKCSKDADGIACTDRTAPSVWAWSTLFAQTCLSEYLEPLRYKRTVEK